MTVNSQAIELREKFWQRSEGWARVWRYLSIKAWGNLPSITQRRISKGYAKVYDQAWSRHLITPYCRLCYADPDYLDQFKPPNGKMTYETFQDFFTRNLKELPSSASDQVWPCEGVLCHSGLVAEIPQSNVKGDRYSLDDIFGLPVGSIPTDYHYANIFLHNKHYHRIHSPIAGTVRRIQHINGDLVVLRPWIYRENPSVPAFRNERINIDIEDEEGRTWHLSVVGGPAVGTIELPEGIAVGSSVEQLDEIALFYLGSTCCIAGPVAHQPVRIYDPVALGMTY